jgi:hypothetical protein
MPPSDFSQAVWSADNTMGRLTSEGSWRAGSSAPSLFADGPQVALEALRKENLELRATIAQLTKRVESLERRLSRAERGNIRLLCDEVELPDASPSLLRFPIEIERGMQSDVFGRSWGPGLGAGAILWNR